MKQMSLSDLYHEFEGIISGLEAEQAAQEAEEQPVTTVLPKPDAIVQSVYDIILNTLQGRKDITGNEADTMIKLAHLATIIQEQ